MPQKRGNYRIAPSEVAEALAVIRDERLYRATHSTFEDYCRERWGMSRQRAHQQIAAAEVNEIVSTMVDTKLPERQARELADLRDDPDTLREVYQAASDATEGKVTAAAIRAVRTPAGDKCLSPDPAPEGDRPRRENVHSKATTRATRAPRAATQQDRGRSSRYNPSLEPESQGGSASTGRRRVIVSTPSPRSRGTPPGGIPPLPANPIVVTADGLILDGRNRAAACQIAGVEPETVVYEGDDLAEYVIDCNSARRHMSTGARAMATALVLQAVKRRVNGRWSRGSVLGNDESVNSGAVWAQRLKECGLILDHRPDLAEQVVSGDLALHAAHEEAQAARRAALLPTGNESPK